MSNVILNEMFDNKTRIGLTSYIRNKKLKDDSKSKKSSSPDSRAIAKLRTLFSNNTDFTDAREYEKWISLAETIENLRYLNIPLLYEVLLFTRANGIVEVNDSIKGKIQRAAKSAVLTNKSLPNKNFTKNEKELSDQRMEVGFIRYLLLVQEYRRKYVKK